LTRPDRGLPEAPPAIEPERLSPDRVAAAYAELGGEIRAFLLGLTRDAEQSEELLQATFSRLVEVGHTARDVSLRGWLFRVAYNEVMRSQRRRGVHRRGLERLWRDAAAAPSAVPWSGLVRSEEVERVRRALAVLPPEQRHVVERRIWAGMTFAEIAAETAAPIGTVLTRMRLALRKLGQALHDDDHDDHDDDYNDDHCGTRDR